jgi:hypothetical protein
MHFKLTSDLCSRSTPRRVVPFRAGDIPAARFLHFSLPGWGHCASVPGMKEYRQRRHRGVFFYAMMASNSCSARTGMRPMMLTFLVVATALTGCVSKTRWGIADTQKKLLELQPGMTKAEVVRLLGTPNSRELIPDREGKTIEFLFYQTRFTGDAVLFAPSDSQLTPFMFVNDRLIGWTRNFYDRTIRQEITVREIIEIHPEIFRAKPPAKAEEKSNPI